jgi:starch synthase (maltosyl-transferring)
VTLEQQEGRVLLEKATRRGAQGDLADIFLELDPARQAEVLVSDATAEAAAKIDQADLTRSANFSLPVDRPIARAGAWYEMVPRSQGRVPGRHGTFDDCIARLPEIATLGFDVLYLPPIHPIGHTNRKGRNNAPKSERGDPGCFYAIGSEAGGHDVVHPELGTLADFRRLVAACADHISRSRSTAVQSR